MGVVLKVFPDVLDVGVVLKHGAGLAVYAAVRLDCFDSFTQNDALYAFFLVLRPYTYHVEIYMAMVIQVTQNLQGREQAQLTLAGTYAAADRRCYESESYKLALLVLNHE